MLSKSSYVSKWVIMVFSFISCLRFMGRFSIDNLHPIFHWSRNKQGVIHTSFNWQIVKTVSYCKLHYWLSKAGSLEIMSWMKCARLHPLVWGRENKGLSLSFIQSNLLTTGSKQLIWHWIKLTAHLCWWFSHEGPTESIRKQERMVTNNKK